MKKAQPQDEFLRKRAARQKKIRKRRLITSFVVFMILAFCTLAVLCLTVFFPIEKIVISGSSVYTAEALEKASGVAKGDNLFTASKSQIEKKLKGKLPYVERIKLDRKLPGTLKITVTDAEEFACYLVGGRYYLVSQSGWVLDECDVLPEKLMTVIGADAECKIGTAAIFKDDTQGELVNSIIDICSAYNVNLSTLDISDTLNLKVVAEERFEVQLGTVNNLEEKIKHLSGMIKEIDSEKSGKINLSMWSEDNPQGTFLPTVTE